MRDEKWDKLSKLLNDIVGSETHMILRMRYNTNVSIEERQKEKESFDKHQQLLWFTAKQFYCENKAELDKIYDDLKQEACDLDVRLSARFESFNAMRQVVEEEMTRELESNLTDQKQTES